MASLAGLARLNIETSTDSVLSRESPSWRFYESSTNTFGGDEIVVLAAEAQHAFDPEVVRTIASISADLEEVAGVRRVDSISTMPLVHAGPDGTLELDPAIEPGASDGEVAGAVAKIEKDRVLPKAVVSEDGRTFAVVVRMDDIGAENDQRVVEAVRESSKRLGSAWISGGPVFRTETNRLMRSELAIFFPVTGLIIGLLLMLPLRGARVPIVVLAVGSVGSLLTLGTMGALGVPLTISTVVLPSVLLALGCAYSLHVVSAIAAAQGAPGRIEVELVRVVAPIVVSGVTTAIGFVAMTLVRIDVIRWIGAFGALGCLFVLAAAISLAPALLALFPVAEVRSVLVVRARDAIVGHLRSLLTRPVAILAGWAAILLVVGVGISRLDIETDVILYFQEDSTPRKDYREIRTRLSGISPMNVVISSEGDRRVTDPDVLRSIDGLQHFLGQLPEVGKAVSLADPLRQLHGGFLGDSQYPLPVDENGIEQYLLLLESVDYMGDVVTADRRQANLLLRVDNNGSNDLLRVARASEGWWEDFGPADFDAQVTGIMHEYARSEREIERGQLRGLVFAFVAVGIVLGILLRSVRMTVVSLIPNATPVVFAFGLMGLLDIPLDAGTVLLGTLALGIAIDDTIHVVVEYRRHRSTLPAAEAVAGALRRTLPPVLGTTVVIAVGFGVLGLSGFNLVRNLGLVTAAIMGVCLLADLLLLPALLVVSAPREGASE